MALPSFAVQHGSLTHSVPGYATMLFHACCFAAIDCTGVLRWITILKPKHLSRPLVVGCSKGPPQLYVYMIRAKLENMKYIFLFFSSFLLIPVFMQP